MTKTLNTTEREPFLSRRVMLGAAVVATAGLAISLVTSRGSGTETASRQRNKPKRTTADLMKPGPLPDLSIGKADAPVTIVEYASMTCPHCAAFHNTVLPVLKEKYIDTGKVRLVFREFLLDERGAVAAMMARCAGNERALPLADSVSPSPLHPASAVRRSSAGNVERVRNRPSSWLVFRAWRRRRWPSRSPPGSPPAAACR